MQAEKRNTLDYQIPGIPQFGSQKRAVNISYGFSVAATIVLLVSMVGMNYTQNFGVGLLFGAVMILSWILALIGIISASTALWRSRGKQGTSALIFGIAVIASSFVLATLVPDPGLGNPH